jgi:hypothetical protein
MSKNQNLMQSTTLLSNTILYLNIQLAALYTQADNKSFGIVENFHI